jgi:hypothetical protein
LKSFCRKYSTKPITRTSIPIIHRITEPSIVIFKFPKTKNIIRAELAIILIIIAPSIPKPLLPLSEYLYSINKAIPIPKITAPKNCRVKIVI